MAPGVPWFPSRSRLLSRELGRAGCRPAAFAAEVLRRRCDAATLSGDKTFVHKWAGKGCDGTFGLAPSQQFSRCRCASQHQSMTPSIRGPRNQSDATPDRVGASHVPCCSQHTYGDDTFNW
jgi:hypothetical protein